MVPLASQREDLCSPYAGLLGSVNDLESPLVCTYDVFRLLSLQECCSGMLVMNEELQYRVNVLTDECEMSTMDSYS